MNMEYLSIYVILNFFHHCPIVFSIQIFLSPWLNSFLSMYFTPVDAIANGIEFLISSIVFSIYRWFNMVAFTWSTTTISRMNLLITMLIALVIEFLNQGYNLLKLAYQGVSWSSARSPKTPQWTPAVSVEESTNSFWEPFWHYT